MRRHLCLFGLVFVAAMMIGIPWIMRAAPADVPLHEERVAAAGRVGWKGVLCDLLFGLDGGNSARGTE